MTDRRLSKIGGAMVSLMLILAPITLVLDYLWPAQPTGGQSAITVHRTDTDTRICGPGELSDADIEAIRKMHLAGATKESIDAATRQKISDTPPLCVTLGKVPSGP